MRLRVWIPWPHSSKARLDLLAPPLVGRISNIIRHHRGRARSQRCSRSRAAYSKQSAGSGLRNEKGMRGHRQYQYRCQQHGTPGRSRPHPRACSQAWSHAAKSQLYPLFLGHHDVPTATPVLSTSDVPQAAYCWSKACLPHGLLHERQPAQALYCTVCTCTTICLSASRGCMRTKTRLRVLAAE